MSDRQELRIFDKNLIRTNRVYTRLYEILIRFVSDKLINSGLALYLLLIEVLKILLEAIEVVLARVIEVLHPPASFLSIFNFLNVSC
jgi:hypothetical protein